MRSRRRVGETILKGLVWCCALREDKEVARALTALALSAYRKIPKKGPREVKIGNACVYALGAMPGMEGVGQLALLKVRVKFGTAQKMIEKALESTAKGLGLPRDELEEMAVPAYGLTEVGRRTEIMGEFTAQLTVAGGGTELVWIKADGKAQRSIPTSVKTEHADYLKELQAAVKDIKRMLPAQRGRIDTLYLPQWNLRAEFWIEGAGDNYETDTNESAVFHWVTADQVRFYPVTAAQVSSGGFDPGYTPRQGEEATEPLALEEIPPLVFSEVMRDVDLFVGVASVGNDPSWSDGGP